MFGLLTGGNGTLVIRVCASRSGHADVTTSKLQTNGERLVESHGEYIITRSAVLIAADDYKFGPVRTN